MHALYRDLTPVPWSEYTINDYIEKCLSFSLNTRDDCECIVRSIASEISLRDVWSFEERVFPQIMEAADIDVSLVGKGINYYINEKQIESTAYNIKECCQCSSDICHETILFLSASFKNSIMANDIFLPDWYSKWCSENRENNFQKNKSSLEIYKNNVVKILINDKGKILADNKPITIDKLGKFCENRIKRGDFSKNTGSSMLIFSITTSKKTKYSDYISVLDQIKNVRYWNEVKNTYEYISKISIANPPNY